MDTKKTFVFGFLFAVLTAVACESNNQSTSKNQNSILNWKPPKDWYLEFPYYISGFDYDGRPIVVLEFGKWNMRSKLVQGAEMAEAMEKYADQWGRNMIYLGRAFDEVGGVTCIADMEGLDYRTLAHVPTMLLAIRATSGFGFEVAQTLGQGIIINLNYAAERLVNIMKHVLGSILDKTELLGTNKERWAARLRSIIPPSQLPPWYSGNRKDWKPLQILGQGVLPDVEMLKREQGRLQNSVF